jgi:hypothetical protein
MLRMSLLASLAVIGVSATAQSTEIYMNYVPSKGSGTSRIPMIAFPRS